MFMIIKVTNVYEDGETFEFTKRVNVPEPEPDDAMDIWAEDNLFEHTGTGRTEGDAGYFVEITECPEQPHLKGSEFEWGV